MFNCAEKCKPAHQIVFCLMKYDNVISTFMSPMTIEENTVLERQFPTNPPKPSDTG